MAAIEYQRTILADGKRNDALVAALKKTIKPGDTVIDIGSGTGFLAMAARSLGAGHCILIERDPDIAALSKELIKQNGIKSCTVMAAHSTELRDLPKADVIVSETFGNFAYEENIIETLKDAKRFLKPGGKIIPASATQWIAPVTSSRLYEELASWKHVGHGLKFDAAMEKSMNNIYVKEIAADDLLKGENVAKQWDAVDFRKDKNESVRTGEAVWSVLEDTTVYGFCVWWESVLAPGITISTSPYSAKTHWKQIYLPLLSPVALKMGDDIGVEITSDSRPEVKINVTWETVHGRNGVAAGTQKLDMMKGY